MSELLFGTAGIPESTKGKGTVDGVRRIRELGLDCMEVEFVQGVRMKEEMARRVGEAAREVDVALSVHGPYWINLNSQEPEKVEASRQRILNSARIGHFFGARGVAFHAAFYMGAASKAIYPIVKKHLRELASQLRKEKVNVSLDPETTGKGAQFGSLDEVLRLSKGIKGVRPCIDFAHIYARSVGEYNSYREFAEIMETVRSQLGDAAVKDLHIHLSGIEYGPKGEKNHLILKETLFDYVSVLKALKDFKAGGLLICESPILEHDALIMQKTYRDL
ncbi:MAG: TIM barrel protein [Nitrospinota bacterium]